MPPTVPRQHSTIIMTSRPCVLADVLVLLLSKLLLLASELAFEVSSVEAAGFAAAGAGVGSLEHFAHSQTGNAYVAQVLQHKVLQALDSHCSPTTRHSVANCNPRNGAACKVDIKKERTSTIIIDLMVNGGEIVL